MYTQAKYSNITVEEYLKLEVESVIRHEYIGGQVYQMLGGSDNCQIITENMIARLRTYLSGTGYRVFSSEMKVKIEPLNVFYYPEISVTRDLYDREKFFKTRPCLIVEVISPAIERIYRSEKLMSYQHLESLEEYVLVSQSDMKVDIYRKSNRQNWILESFQYPRNIINLSSVGLTITMAEIYEDVNFNF